MPRFWQQLISRHEKLRFLDLCLRHVNDEPFRARVLGRDENTLALQVHPEGGRSGILYRIRIGHKGDGFFAEYRRMLNYLYYADQLHLIPYIECTLDYTYAEDHPVNGHSNPYEYYWEQPCVQGENVGQYRYEVVNRECDLQYVRTAQMQNGYDLPEEYVVAIAGIIRKYIRPNGETQAMMRDADAFLGGRKTLGVHVRLTDFKQNYYGHPTCITPDQHLQAAKDAVTQYGFDQVFLATDDVETVQMFKETFGDRLLTYEDVTRSDGSVSVAFSKGTRENHRYLLGLEVLRDMYTLSICDGLIAGKSQVSICAYLHRRDTGDYICRTILDAGYNKDITNKYSDHMASNQ